MTSSTPWRLTSNRRGSFAITATATRSPSSCAAVTSSRVTSRSSPRRCSATTKLPFIGADSFQPLLEDLLDPPRDVCGAADQDLRPLAFWRREHAPDPVGGVALVVRGHDVDLLLLGLLDRPQRRVPRLVDPRLDRQQRRRVDLGHVDQAALQLTMHGGAGA